jgi:hypothetical protein
MRIISVQFRLAENPYKPPEKAVSFGFLFLRPEPRDGYPFSRRVESNRSTERIFFSECAGALRGLHPAGVGSGEPGGVEAREGRIAPLPTDRRETISGRVPQYERRAV